MRKLGSSFKEAVAAKASNEKVLGGTRAILANLGINTGSNPSPNCATSVTDESMLRYYAQTRNTHKGIRALHISMDGLTVGHDVTEVAFAYSPELLLGSVPPIRFLAPFLP